MDISPISLYKDAADGQVWDAEQYNSDQTAIETAVNDLITELAAHEAVANGADSITCDAIGTLNGGLGGSVYVMLDALYDYVGALQAGSIADGSIGIEKLNFVPLTAEDIGDIAPAITGAASTIATDNLAASRALVSSSGGKVAVSTVTAAELAMLIGTKFLVQNQLDTKAPKGGYTPSRALGVNSNGEIAVSGVTTTELNYLAGLASNLQTQLNAKLGTTGKAYDTYRIAGKKIYVQGTAPTSPAVGDIWIDT